jgi:1-deoxy-D-xylulose-5-phosphate synthase
LTIGKGRVLCEGTQVALLSFGAHLPEVLAAATLLERQGVSCTVADARFAKPLDHNLIDQLVAHHRAVLTIEQGAVGGFGAQVLHYLAETGQLQSGAALRSLVLPDQFIDQASPEAMYAAAGLTADKIAAHALRMIGVESLQMHRGGAM